MPNRGADDSAAPYNDVRALNSGKKVIVLGVASR